jgi:3-oxoacyl-[acyl-carrier protein] reductase
MTQTSLRGIFMRLAGRTALITGSSRNIGREIALTFAREGANLILNARSSISDLEQVAEECRKFEVEVITVQADVSSESEVNNLALKSFKKFQNIDILINNAAIRPHKPLLETTYADWKQVFSTNLDPCFYLTKALLPQMISNNYGSIVALGGMATLTGRPNTAAVTSSKSAVLGFIKAIASEFAMYNIRANMVNPGSINTERKNPEWYPEYSKDSRDSSKNLNKIPLGRQGTTTDIANACLFLASEESSYITGDQINAVGGRFIVASGHED